ncbi:hypothetical protein [Umezawaea tangerina]|uniref:Uncharacterized protein n=1 Tax=Umezawaea tangerina TaxID=84725 RepID=A0A2T0TCF1_9PSEU|nr:hypothetical protein [Umezawaea tangerina]PRY43308.1 hypothetical protein CLV43_10348 [Umezawaea tangerina]
MTQFATPIYARTACINSHNGKHLQPPQFDPGKRMTFALRGTSGTGAA